MGYQVAVMGIWISLLIVGTVVVLGRAVIALVRPSLAGAFHLLASLAPFDRNDAEPQVRSGL